MYTLIKGHLSILVLLLTFASLSIGGGGSKSSSIFKVHRVPGGDEELSKESSIIAAAGGEIVGAAESAENDKEKNSVDNINDSTFTTASLMNQLLRSNGNHEHETVQYLDRVKNPEEVAIELESAAKYLMHQAELTQGRMNSSGGFPGGGVNHEDEKNADLVRVLDGLVVLNNLYDALVRPGQFDEDGPTIITVNAGVHPWLEINEEKNEMTVTLTLTQNWTDTRLAYQSRLLHPGKLPYVTLTSYMHSVELWIPDTFIMNEKRSFKHDVTMPNDLVRITSKGQVSREQRITVTVHCPFYKNERFPFDTPACSLKFASFSWNNKNLRYHWAPTSYREAIEPDAFTESNGFTVSSVELQTTEFNRDDISAGASSGLIVEFKLRRNLGSYITKLYLPLGSFCLIAIIGLISPIGPDIGSALSYFMFGLQSIFMAISFTGPDFNWGNSRTALDSYYVLSVLTIFLTGIVNLFRLRINSSSPLNKSSAVEESFEMHGSCSSIPKGNPPRSRLGNGRNSKEGRLWRDSDNFIDDHDGIEEDDNDGDVDVDNIRPRSPTSRHTSSAGVTGFILIGLKSAKLMLIKLRRRFSQFCCRMMDFSVWILLLFFIIWNSHYWIRNLN